MTDVQVSSARRISFTAFAVFAFVFVVLFAYQDTLDSGHELALDLGLPGCPPLLDAVFLEFVITNSPPLLPDTPQLLDELQTALLERWRERLRWKALWPTIPCLSLLPILFLGMAVHNSPMRAARDVRLLVAGALIAGNIACAVTLGSHNWIAEAPHNVSAFWLLLPILTTAFVITGAWRRASPKRRRDEPKDRTVMGDEFEQGDDDFEFDVFDE